MSTNYMSDPGISILCVFLQQGDKIRMCMCMCACHSHFTPEETEAQAV